MNNLSPTKDLNMQNRSYMIKLGLKDRTISNDITGNSTSVSHPISNLSYLCSYRMIPSMFLQLLKGKI